ncbi:MAG TPA: SH3 domain-containing protein [Candidatus Avacidaminococcus intestinavium]|uniref:SH3 domain-containing protein n=1 Tax=Candidatus Avacidaminococcus intestinavium TaxID=2840684 RepID=A0A9D1SLV7_9FIRM|nr:SH3 domain-containing protein [Candidatus Avacidaminococcus intestinavium]
MKRITTIIGLAVLVVFMQFLSLSVAVAKDASTVNVRKVIREEKYLDAEYPVVYGLENNAAQEKINDDINEYIKKINQKAEKERQKTKLRYYVHKNAQDILSMTLDATSDNAEADATYGLNYTITNGKKITLDHYFKKAEAAERAQEGLSYVFGIEQEIGKLATNNFYIDIDDNIIAIYPPGQVTDAVSGVIEINLTVSDPEPLPAKEIVRPEIKDYEAKGFITGTDVRLRKEPGLEGAIIDYLVKNEPVSISKEASNDGIKWYYVTRSNGMQGWVAGTYCGPDIIGVRDDATQVYVKDDHATQKTNDALVEVSGVITGFDVRMRSEPSRQSDVLDWFNEGEVVTISDEASGDGLEWYKVRRSNGVQGWVAAQYCQKQDA